MQAWFSCIHMGFVTGQTFLPFGRASELPSIVLTEANTEYLYKGGITCNLLNRIIMLQYKHELHFQLMKD